MTVRSGHILLLAGTLEARKLSARLVAAFPDFRVTPSFAGVVKDLPDLGIPSRVGGFDGRQGLVRYCREESVTLIIDATHPFAARMSENAAGAAADLNLPLLRLERPAWIATSQDDWQNVSSFVEAAGTLPERANVFLGVGRKEVHRFSHRQDLKAVVRMIEAPDQPLPEIWELILARPPQDVADEVRLFEEHAISHVVTKNSGGTRSFAKVLAARQLGLRVIMIDRPALPKARIAAGVEETLQKVSLILNADVRQPDQAD